MQLHPADAVAGAAVPITIFLQTHAAVIAKSGAEVIFLPAIGAVIRYFARRHGQKNPIVSLDEFDVAYDQCAVEGQRAKRLETASAMRTQMDANLGQEHDVPPGTKPLLTKRRVTLSKARIAAGREMFSEKADRRIDADVWSNYIKNAPKAT
jgi:hypothetical protein